MLGECRRSKQIRVEGFPRGGATVGKRGSHAGEYVKSGDLSKSNFRLGFSLIPICLGLSVRSPRDMVTRIEREVGPFDQAVSTRRSHKLNCEQDHQNDKKKLSESSNHYPLPLMKSFTVP
jgi:hypothetical protein